MITKNKCVVYARTNSTRQNTFSQIKAGVIKAKALGYEEREIVVIEDLGISSMAVKLEDRDGVVKLRELMRENNVQLLIVTDSSRISRNSIEYYKFINDLNKFNVKLVFSHPDATNDDMRETAFALHFIQQHFKINF